MEELEKQFNEKVKKMEKDEREKLIKIFENIVLSISPMFWIAMGLFWAYDKDPMMGLSLTISGLSMSVYAYLYFRERDKNCIL